MRQTRQCMTIVSIAAVLMRVLIFALVIAALHPARTEAGNPLFTNDPETPGAHGWEINISHNIERLLAERNEDLPLFNINYGSTANNQWKISIPVRHLDPSRDNDHWGIGDIQLGWKYRFIEEDEHGFMASVYPQPLLPTGNDALVITDSLGIGDGRVELFLPAQVGKHLFDDKLFMYGEVGYNVVFEDSPMNSWFYGLAGEWQATEKLELVGEVAGLAFPGGGEPDDTFFFGGFNYRLTEHVVFMTSFGRSFRDARHGTPDFLSYIGLQFVWSGNSNETESGCCHRSASPWNLFSRR